MSRFFALIPVTIHLKLTTFIDNTKTHNSFKNYKYIIVVSWRNMSAVMSIYIVYSHDQVVQRSGHEYKIMLQYSNMCGSGIRFETFTSRLPSYLWPLNYSVRNTYL